MAVGYTYTIKEECPICCYKIQVTKVRSRLVKVSEDNDFCAHYKGFNPYYYAVWCCQHCGYAADGRDFKKLKQADMERVAMILLRKNMVMEYTPDRSRADAIQAFKNAIFQAGFVRARPVKIAGLCLKLGWLYREAKEEEKEREMLVMAAHYYDQALTTERFPIGGMTDNTVVYLLGVLYYRTGETEKALRYLSRLIHDKGVRFEYRIYKKAQDLWQDIREKRDREESAETAEVEKKIQNK